LWIEGCYVVIAAEHTSVILSFPDQSQYYSFQYLLIYAHEAEWTQFQTHYYSENEDASGNEPRISRSAYRNYFHETTGAVYDSVILMNFIKWNALCMQLQ
jgi:hypothetical protein